MSPLRFNMELKSFSKHSWNAFNKISRAALKTIYSKLSLLKLSEYNFEKLLKCLSDYSFQLSNTWSKQLIKTSQVCGVICKSPPYHTHCEFFEVWISHHYGYLCHWKVYWNAADNLVLLQILRRKKTQMKPNNTEEKTHRARGSWEKWPQLWHSLSHLISPPESQEYLVLHAPWPPEQCRSQKAFHQ